MTQGQYVKYTVSPTSISDQALSSCLANLRDEVNCYMYKRNRYAVCVMYTLIHSFVIYVFVYRYALVMCEPIKTQLLEMCSKVVPMATCKILPRYCVTYVSELFQFSFTLLGILHIDFVRNIAYSYS